MRFITNSDLDFLSRFTARPCGLRLERLDFGVFRADIVVDGRIIVELKTAELISKAHEAQVLHYLRASEMEVGLVMNFGPVAKFRRIEMRNDRKKRMLVGAL